MSVVPLSKLVSTSIVGGFIAMQKARRQILASVPSLGRNHAMMLEIPVPQETQITIYNLESELAMLSLTLERYIEQTHNVKYEIASREQQIEQLRRILANFSSPTLGNAQDSDNTTASLATQDNTEMAGAHLANQKFPKKVSTLKKKMSEQSCT